MCFAPKSPKVGKDTAQPEKTAEPVDIGDARTKEDNTLFGGVPDLRVDRSATTGGAAAGGAGLKME